MKVTAYQLLILNFLLQVFDGLATYVGMHLGIKEGNPLVRAAFEICGVGPALLMLKSLACAALTLVYQAIRPDLLGIALGGLAGVYSIASLIPWLISLCMLLVHSL